MNRICIAISEFETIVTIEHDLRTSYLPVSKLLFQKLPHQNFKFHPRFEVIKHKTIEVTNSGNSSGFHIADFHAQIYVDIILIHIILFITPIVVAKFEAIFQMFRQCINPTCYNILYGSDMLEQGEIDVRLNSFKGCFHQLLNSRKGY